MFAGLFSSNNAKDKASIQTSSQRRLSTTAAAKPPVIPNKPPFPHPLPHTKIWVECTQDGLLLAGLRDKSSIFQSRSLLVSYGKTVAVSTVEVTDELQKPRGAYLCHGCLGILRLFNGTLVGLKCIF